MKKQNKCRGSLTLEACMVVPVFIMIMLLLNGFFLMFMGQQMVYHAMIQSAKSLAFDPYISERSVVGNNSLSEFFTDLGWLIGTNDHASTDDWYSEKAQEENSAVVAAICEERFKAYFVAGNDDKLLRLVGFKDGTSGMDFSDCKVEDGVLTFTVKYTQEFVFNAAGLGDMERTLTLQTRLFEYKEY